MSSEPDTESTEPETPEIVTGSPVEVADLEEAELAASDPVAAAGATKFFFAHVGAVKLSQDEVYHVKSNHVTIVDPVLAGKLKELSKIPSNRIFISE